jgi:large subunit ribosomal protein L21
MNHHVDGGNTMYAVFRTGGKQFRAEPGATLLIPTLDAEPGATVTFDDVLLASSTDDEVAVGTPTVDGAKVTAEVIAHDRTRKITVFKRKRRKGYRRKQGHRQGFTVVRVADITV